MSSVNLRFTDISFSYNTTSEIIVSGLNTQFTSGWTGIVGPNGAGKTTIAKLATGLLVPTRGVITGLNKASSFYCTQGVDTPPDKSYDFLYSLDNRSGELMSLLGIQDDWIDRWETLSFGERKRFQTGVSLWLEPDILALDEPTNHLDLSAKELIHKALKTYSGTGILISHDRELLDSLCSSTLFVRPGSIVLRPYGISEGLEEEFLEEKSKAHEHEIAVKEYKRIKKSLQALKQKENRKHDSLSKKNIAKDNHDAKGKIDLARLTGKDKTGSKKVKLLQNKTDSLKTDAESKYFKTIKNEGFTYPGEKYRGDRLVYIPPSVISLGKNRSLNIPELSILPGDRIGITGNNGTGKSTLLSYIISMIKIPEERLILVKQEVSVEEWHATDEKIKTLAGKEKGELLSVVHRLGSEPERILSTPMPSPGEIRKIILGLGLLKNPFLIMMDEPTNHMDLPSVQCLEDALFNFEGAVIIISHDRKFIKKLANTEWLLKETGGMTNLTVKVW